MPNEAPQRFLDKYDPETVPFQSVYAMSSIVDEALRNVTGALQVKGMWPNTLMVVASDNVRRLLPAARTISFPLC
jgi:arylsulfatase A-like enzyme